MADSTAPARTVTRGGAWPWLGLAAFLLGYVATWAVQFGVPGEALLIGRRRAGGAREDTLTPVRHRTGVSGGGRRETSGRRQAA